MRGGLSGEVAVITGAGRGIGRAIARALAREGARVALAARTQADLEEVKAEIENIAEIVLFLLTRRGNAVMDEVHVRRAASDPWF